MKHHALLMATAGFAMAISTTSTRAAMFGDTSVRLLGTPQCAVNNIPNGDVNGTIREHLHGSRNLPQGDVTDPWYPWSEFRGRADYIGLFGGPNLPSVARYIFAKPEASFRFIDGTPDNSDRVEGFANGLRIFDISGEEFWRRFHNGINATGPKPALHAEITPPVLVDEVDISTRSIALEYVIEPGSAGKCD